MIRLLRPSALLTLVLASLACSPKGAAPKACAAEESVCQPAGAGAAAFCANLTVDAAHCGSCDTACGTPTGSAAIRCNVGKCETNCGDGYSSTNKVVCGARGGSGADAGPASPYCTDVTTDHENCGGCGKVCAGNQECRAGACASVGTTACGGSGTTTTYINLKADRANCGACGNACPAAEICTAGSCAACPVAQCNNLCVDTNRDPQNCGACGAAVGPNGTCENGALRAKLISLELLPPLTLGLGPAVSSTLTFSVKVHAQARVSRVTATVGSATPVNLSRSGPSELMPSTWTASVTMPAAGPLSLRLDAYDENWFATAPDAALHTDTASVTLTPTPVPTATPAVVAVTAAVAVSASNPTGTVALGTGTGCIGAPCLWAPLNAGPLTLSTAFPSGTTGLAQVVFRVNGVEVGRTDLAGGLSASFSAQPADLGTASVTAVACGVDAVGQVGPCSAASPAFTIGRVASTTLGLGRDAVGGGHTLYYVATANNTLYAQDATQLNSNATLPGAAQGSNTYKPASLYGTPDGAGVYVIRSDGSAVDRVQCSATVAGCFKPAFVTGAALTRFVAVTNAAMALADSSGNGFFADAVPAQTSAAAVAAGGIPLNDPLPTTRAGAIAGWFETVGAPAVSFDVYHPSLPGNHLLQPIGIKPNLSLLAVNVFPGGEIIFQYQDPAAANPNSLMLGAVLVNGTSAPVVLPPFQIGPNGGTESEARNFIVAKPGVLVGEVPNPSDPNKYQAILINLNGTPSKTIFPSTTAVIPGPPATTVIGTVQDGGLYDRNRTLNSFAVSDDGSKALYVTADPTAGAVTVFHVHLIDLASASDAVVGSGEALNGGSGEGPSTAWALRPQFVHSAPVFAGGAPAGTHQAAFWGDAQNTANNSLYVLHYRLGLSDYAAGTSATVDRVADLISNSPGLSPVASATAGSLFFLGSGDSGGFSLFSVPLTANGTATATRLVDRVFGFAIREDKGVMLVERADGVLLVGKLASLAPGGTAAAALKPIIDNGPLGDPDLGGAGAATFGFTPDGDHAYVLRNTRLELFSQALAGTLETIDLNTGVRTNWGRDTPFYNFSTSPPAGFLSNASAAIFTDDLTAESNIQRLVTATAAASTRHRDTGLFYGTQRFPLFLFSTSIDGNEGFLKSFLNSVSVAVEKDGSVIPFPGSSEGAGQQATFSPYGGPYRPDYSQINQTTPRASYFKVWGGASPSGFVTLLRGATALSQTNTTRQTPDNAEYLDVFQAQGDAAGSYGIVLGLNGHAPAVPLTP